MKSLSCVCLSFLYLLFGGAVKEDYFIMRINNIERVNIYSNGEMIYFDANSEIAKEIFEVYADMLDGYHETPSLGVALNDEVKEETKSGLWVEFEYDNYYDHNGMAYTKLLMRLEPDCSGYNLIRYDNGKYEGRCFYISLMNKNTTLLYNKIKSLF